MQFGATPRRALPGALVVPADGHGCVLPALTYFYDNALGGYQDLLDGVLELPLPRGRAGAIRLRRHRVELEVGEPRTDVDGDAYGIPLNDVAGKE